MRMIRTLNAKEHLCDTCPRYHDFPMCLPENVEFGSGRGNDNIIACCHCTSPYSDTIYPGELINVDVNTQDVAGGRNND